MPKKKEQLGNPTGIVLLLANNQFLLFPGETKIVEIDLLPKDSISGMELRNIHNNSSLYQKFKIRVSGWNVEKPQFLKITT